MLLLLAPWVVHGVLTVDRVLVRWLLGPTTSGQRVRELEQTRAQAVDDSASTLRRIERDLHDGTQARLVALAMNVGLAREKLAEGRDPAEAERLLVKAHTTAKEAIVELRDLARGIHPPVLDAGLDSALATLAAHSAVPVDLRTAIAVRPSPAIETIAYFCAAELLTNVAKHSRAEHARLDARTVEGRVWLQVSDDGRGGASVGAGSGLSGLSERVRTVDGRLSVQSPDGGPTVVTIELPLQSAAHPMRVVIAEDSVILRDGLVHLLADRGHEVVAAVADGDAFRAAVAAHDPDVCIVDIRMPPTFTDEGLRAAIAVRHDHPGVGVLVFSQYVETRYAAELLAGSIGGVGYLLKDRVADVREFVDALARVADGGTALDPEVVAQLLGASGRTDALAGLTPREREVLEKMAEGRSNAGIAAALVVSDRAVEKHVANIFMKLGLPPSEGENRRVLAVLRYLDS